jgi:antitoxin (DNA-binding transcriptional repressor) of toxin-antitoxin stability system
MKRYTVHEAKSQLSRLIQEALQGEEVVITNRSVPVVKLAVIPQMGRESLIGDMKGKIWMSDDFNDTPEDFDDYV